MNGLEVMELKVDLVRVNKHHQARKLPHFIGHLSLLEKEKLFSENSAKDTSTVQGNWRGWGLQYFQAYVHKFPYLRCSG